MEQTLAAARDRLTREAYKAAWREGRSATLDELFA
jgi:hypothetical protein